MGLPGAISMVMLCAMAMMAGSVGAVGAVANVDESVPNMVKAWGALPVGKRGELAKQPFAEMPMGKEEASQAVEALWAVKVADLKAERKKEWDAKSIALAGKVMKFEYKVFGEKPKEGRSLFISMHGGGGAPPDVNEQQWKNQIGLYTPKEGVYLAPRAPTDTWNLWHEAHIDDFFDRIIEDAVVFEGVDPNKVYLMGYSAGGDGAYQLAPRMADRWAAASMMAGHPNDAKPDNLRNLPFAIHMGANDGAYDRNKVAKQWGEKLDQLQKEDPYRGIMGKIKKGQKDAKDGGGGSVGREEKPFPHVCELHAGKGHWMDREDAVAVEWMAGYVRDPFPKYVVWQQGARTHDRFYWLGVPAKEMSEGSRVVALVQGQQITVTATGMGAGMGAATVELWLSDELVDLDKPVKVQVKGKPAQTVTAKRTAGAIWAGWERADRAATATARVSVAVEAGEKKAP